MSTRRLLLAALGLAAVPVAAALAAPEETARTILRRLAAKRP